MADGNVVTPPTLAIEEAGTLPHVSWQQALCWRMGQHHLLTRATPAEVLRVAGDICGIHAQLMSSAELSLWARIDGLEREAVQRALWTDRTLVKLWAMRGTLHLIPAADLGQWVAALGTYTGYGNTYPKMDVLASAVDAALAGQPLTREELATEVERRTGAPEYAEWVRFSWGSYLKPISFRGQLCFAASEGGRIRFTTPATWLAGELDRSDPADALRAITRRYLRAYAPATAQDLARWWVGGTPSKGKRMLAALGEEAIEIAVEGERAWVLATDLPQILSTEPSNAARLLPAFDPWTIGASRTAAAMLDPIHKARVYRAQGWISPVVLVNGRMAGVWKHTRKGRRLLVEIDPFDPLPDWAHGEIEAEVERLAMFLGRDVELELRPVR